MKTLRKEQAELDIKVVLDKKKVEEVLNKTLDNFRKNMTIKGFRKGMAPLDRVKASVKQSDLLGQSLNSLINESIKQAASQIKEEDKVIDGPTYKLDKYSQTEFEITFTYPVRPEFTLKDFRTLNLEFKKPTLDIEKLVENEVKAFTSRFAKWQTINEEAKTGDKVKVDLKSDIIKYNVQEQQFVDYEIIIGKGVLLKEFEDQIIGLKVGETREIKINLPMTHTIEALRGKDVVYELKLKSIERFISPAISDELVKQAKIANVENVEAFNKFIKENIIKREEVAAKDRFVHEVINKLKMESGIKLSPISSSNEASRMLQDFKKRLEQQKISVAKWFNDNKMDETKLFEMYKAQAQGRFTEGLILSEIAKSENIKNTDEEIEKKYEEFSKLQKIKIDMAKKMFPKANIELALTNEKVVELITKHFSK